MKNYLLQSAHVHEGVVHDVVTQLVSGNLWELEEAASFDNHYFVVLSMYASEFLTKNFNIYFFIYCPQKAQQTLGTRRNFQQQLKEMLDNETPVKEVSYTVSSWSL